MFNKLKSITIPKIGLRKIKSIIAVVLSFALWQIVRLLVPISLDIHPLFGYIYAIIEMRDSVEKTREFGKRRIIATFIGLFFGILFMPLSVLNANHFGHGMLNAVIDLALILLGALMTLWFAQLFKCETFCGIAAIIFVICLVRDRNSDVNIYLYSILRVTQTLLGIGSAWMVNNFIFNPKEIKEHDINCDYDKKIRNCYEMKRTIRTPYFEVGTKNYVYGDKLLEYAIAADKAAEKYDIDVLFICPALEVRRVVENTKNLFVFSTYMDTLRPGRGCADILPEGLKAAGAVGVMVNHCEKPMSLPQIKATIDRAKELDMYVFACADTLDEAKAIAQLHPDIINPEPSEIIGGGNGSSPMSYVKDSIRVIKEIDPNIMVEQAAGITCGQEVYDFIMAGSEAAGAASGIMNAKDPIAMIDEMIAATRRAADDLKK